MQRKSTKRNECRRLFQPTRIPGIELCTTQRRRWVLERHMHEEYQVSVFDRGFGTLTYRGKREAVGPQDIAIFGPGEVHGGECENWWGLRSMYIPVSLVRKLADQLDWNLHGLPHFTESLVTNRALRTQVRRLVHVLNDADTQLSTETILLGSLSMLFQKCADRGPTAVPVARELRAVTDCRDYIEAHYSEEVAIDTLASISHLSASYLIRSFKKQFGLPPHAFQIQLRLNKAKADLRDGASLSAAAMAHGFYDQSHFHRQFRRTFGVSPGRYRAMVHEW
jgi:AraC-like DNA-binding protein